MKKFAKLISLVLVLSMVLLLAGCASEKDKILGTWEAEINFADSFNEGLAEGGDEVMADYLSVDAFNLVVVLEFNEDDTYEVWVDEDCVEDTFDDLKEELGKNFEDYLEYLIEENDLDMTVAEFMELMQYTMEELLDEIITDDMIDDLVEGMEGEGQFLVEEGKLYISDDTDEDVDDDEYVKYSIDGKTLVFEDASNDFVFFGGTYVEDLCPIEFAKEQ